MRESPITDAFIWRDRRRVSQAPKVDIHAEPAAVITEQERTKRIALLESALEGWLPKSPWGQRIRRGFERQLERLKAHD